MPSLLSCLAMLKLPGKHFSQPHLCIKLCALYLEVGGRDSSLVSEGDTGVAVICPPSQKLDSLVKWATTQEWKPLALT